MATYLSLVNSVLARLRESSVATVTTNDYSSLIGKFVNDSKRAVEDSWNWDCLSTTITLSLVQGTSNYVVTGSGRRQKDVTVNDTSSQARVHNVPAKWIEDQQQLSNVQTGSPVYYAWDGFDGTDSKMTFFPTPDAAYTVKVNLIVPQVELASDGDVILVPSEPVILGAYARALVERGEDGGLNSSEAYGLYKSSLSDHIALEAHRQDENTQWVVC
jgi:hypothetical protein